MQPKYSVGDRVIVRVYPNHQLPDLPAQGAEFVGTVVSSPGVGLYDVVLDEPPSPEFNSITYLDEGRLRPANGEAPEQPTFSLPPGLCESSSVVSD